MENFIQYILGLITAIIGALPFGLVNLSVMKESYHYGIKPAMKIAYGATFVELVFAVTALLTGKIIQSFLIHNIEFNYAIIAFIFITGIYFFIKKNKLKEQNKANNNSNFLSGIFYNLISIQVLLFWIIAISYLISDQKIIPGKAGVIFFLCGIITSKVLVLWLYAIYSSKILSRSKILTRNINQIIGGVIILSAFIRIINF